MNKIKTILTSVFVLLISIGLLTSCQNKEKKYANDVKEILDSVRHTVLTEENSKKMI